MALALGAAMVPVELERSMMCCRCCGVSSGWGATGVDLRAVLLRSCSNMKSSSCIQLISHKDRSVTREYRFLPVYA